MFYSVVRYKKDLDVAFLATCSLHNLLNASLLSESGPPMLDFEVMYGVKLFLKVIGMLNFFILQLGALVEQLKFLGYLVHDISLKGH